MRFRVMAACLLVVGSTPSLVFAQQAPVRDPAYATVAMTVDTRFLTSEERTVVGLLMQAADQMTALYQRQAAAADRPDGSGDGLYPSGLTKAEFEAYLSAHPAQKEALIDSLTVVRRDGERLVAVPYSTAYSRELTKAASLLRQAADATSNMSLKSFLRLRAEALLSNDYFQSELAWVDVKDTPIAIGIGPSGTDLDGLYGRKMTFRASISLIDPKKSAKLDKYKAYLRAMEANLPVDDRYKNYRRGSASPISVEEQIWHGGASTVGPQGIAYNAPDDERVREAKGARKGILWNVLDAKYDAILQPMAQRVLVSDQSGLVNKKYFATWILFHELSHSLGPGSITLEGRQTTVMGEMKDIGATAEEVKADAMGVYNVEFMMRRGEFPRSENAQLLATYFVGLFRIVRFGVDEAHGRGAALQYGYLKSKGAFAWDRRQNRFRIDEVGMQAAVSDLVAELVRLQGDGDYAGMTAFFDRYAHLDADADRVIATLKDIPTDITAVYPRQF